jgi:acetyltransferase-like isoleucine patch superfamily enzyme
LTCANKIEIGINTAIAANVTITDITHPYANIDHAPDKQILEVGFVKIGEDCKIYNNVVILPNTILGKHTVVGANSVVFGRQYPDFCVLVGTPAKIIKRYNFEKNIWQKTNAEGEFI